MRVLPLACAVTCTVAIASIAASFVAPGIAHADGAGVIVATGSERAKVAAALADAMAGRAARIVPDGVAEARAALAAGAVPSEALVRFRKVREQVDTGWREYLRVAVESSLRLLANARTEAEALVVLPEGAEVYADVALRLGVVLGHLGRRGESQAVLALALALDPDRPITLAEFSPDVLDMVAAVRALPVVRQRFRITTDPPGAQVRVDGTDVGRAPVDLEIARGQHVIVARLPMHVSAVQGVAIAEGSTALALELEPDPAASHLATGAERGLDEPRAQELIDATLRFADLDEVVVAADTARRGGPTLLVQRCAGVPARCSAVVDIGYGDQAGLASAARSAWDAVRAGELRYPPTVLADRGGGKLDDGRCKLCRNPWLWTGVGAALVAGAVITLVVTSGSTPPPVVGIDGGAWHD